MGLKGVSEDVVVFLVGCENVSAFYTWRHCAAKVFVFTLKSVYCENLNMRCQAHYNVHNRTWC